MPPIIEIQNLGKQYKLAVAEPYMALRDVISSTVKNMLRSDKKKSEKFWALQDINLDIQPGDRTGIIGRNGAGKSTLLKIISRITPPTTGKAIIRGRVGSLLEVGTGFHPELTGRENIYLNGSILGLKKTEITRQFDTIADFSGVERFIDTPLKHYSSGMQLRLAFSVAAHLDPEILLIDEVLAVGDLEFQKKCLGKMEEVSKKDGRTILFVSHNMDSIRKFCPTTILMDGGKIISIGNTEKIINEYVAKHLETKAEMVWENGASSYNKEVTLNRAYLHNENGTVISRFDTTEKVGITLEYQVLKDDAMFTHGINLYNQENTNIFNSHDVTSAIRLEKRKKGNYKATAWIPGNLLPEGIFTLSVALFLPNPLDILVHEHDALSFETYTDFSKLSARGNYADDFPGVVRPLIPWEAIKTN
ncbi:MAG: ABC transporter ATP-binding protein [Chitinophagaceae bacterium]|nr:ABC transporter ATP-binding protein [Chitinophagaceae bacterium]